MAKINLDKYYTPVELAKSCIEKTFEIIGKENIMDIIEPSAGNGSFSLQLPNCTAYDIAPEHESIIEQDFLKLELPYKKGRLVIGNPPFGSRNTLSVQFYKKSYSLGDYIAFILPVSQYQNDRQMFEFDLIHSEVLIAKYSDVELKTSFNIYKRPKIINKKPFDYTLKDVFLHENRRTGIQLKSSYDIGICSFGSGIVGRIPEKVGFFAKETYFQINNIPLKNKIIQTIKSTDWEKNVCLGISGQTNLAKWQIYKYLKEQIPELS